MGRLPASTWSSLSSKITTCLGADGCVRLINPAGRSIVVERSALAPSNLTMTVHAPEHLAVALRSKGWVKHGRGQGPVVRKGLETGALSGPFLGRGYPTVAALVAALEELIHQVLNVDEVRQLRFEASDDRWAEVLRADVEGSQKRWHHASLGGVAGGPSAGASRERVKDCRRCGQPLNDALSLRRGYGPECWKKLQNPGRGVVQHRPRR